MVAACCLAEPALAATVSVEIQGLTGETEEESLAATGLRSLQGRDVSPLQIRRLFELADERIVEALESFGYYQAQVDASLEQTQRADSYLAIFRVTPGEPVVVQEVDVTVEGAAAMQLPEVQLALDAFVPRPGERLDHATYEHSKERIDTALRTTGFLDAKLIEHRVAVTRAENSAQIDLAWDAGVRHRFGPVSFSPAQFSDEFLQRFVPWREGEFYTSERLLELQRGLVDTEYFASVAITPDLQHVQDTTVPVDVLLIPAKRMQYTAGAHFNTDFGLGGDLGAQRRWLNRRGHQLSGEIGYSQRLKEVMASYRIPHLGKRGRNYSFGVAYRDEQTDSSNAHMAQFAAIEVKDRWNGFWRTFGLQYLKGDFEIAQQEGRTSLLYAEGVLVRDGIPNPVFSSSGYRVTYGMRLAAQSLLSDTSLLQADAEGMWLHQPGEDGRVILRAALGAMVVDDFDALPPQLRFFAGGDRSVRGFDYQQIGETNEQGQVIGGKYLLSGSAEYEHYFLGNWGAAVFLDAGDAFTSKFDANIGAGIGLRWKSPVGLVRVDLARPLASDLGHEWRLHIVIGPDP